MVSSPKRKLVAIMFTDIVGYTRLMQLNEEKAIWIREKHRKIFNTTTEKFNGRILQYYGDGTLSIFDSAIDAVNCGIEMQLGFREDPPIPIRIGIHTGDIILNEEEIIGDSVNIASRIESLAVPGSVFISEKVYDEIKNQESIETTFLKSFSLKNVKNPIGVYAISNEGLIIPDINVIEGKTLEEKKTKSEIREEGGSHTKEGSPDALLATKLYVPPQRSNMVHRSRLTERLRAGLNGKLTLVSAPAGFGKTTLVSDWISENGSLVTWLSLDEGDNELSRFIAYFIAAFQKINSDIGQDALSLLHSPQPPPPESILTSLLNDLSTLQGPIVIVLDDYHVIEESSINDILTFVLDHLPPHMHLVMTTREDPDLPLSKLRVRGQLNEFRIADLRFTTPEVSGFLQQVMGIELSDDDIISLENRTEGWIAGLQLAGLSMQGREDKTGFIRAFAGHDRYIVDYLLEEVLQQQSEDVRDFLLKTSILKRISGPLCDAVTGLNTGKNMLEDLNKGNLFVIPLDDSRRWYRYHHLFGDFLKSKLLEEQPEQAPELHKKASDWYEQNGLREDAIQHAIESGDLERVAALIELAWPVMDGRYKSLTWLNWAEDLPEEMIKSRPVLNVSYAWAMLNIGELEAGEARLKITEQQLGNISDPNNLKEIAAAGLIIVDDEQYRLLKSNIAGAYAFIALSMGRIPEAITKAHDSIDLLPEHDHIQRALGEAFLGLAYYANGDLEDAYQAFSYFTKILAKEGNITFAISPAFVMADMRIIQGRLRDAIQTYEELIPLTEESKETIRGVSDLYLGLAGLFHERGETEESNRYMLINERLGEKFALPDWSKRYSLAKARILESQGEFEKALEQIERAEAMHYRNPVPVIRPTPALTARLNLKLGKLDQAKKWAKEQNLRPDDPIGFLKEFEYMTLARIMIASYGNDKNEETIMDAKDLLKRLKKAAKDGGRMGHVIEILILLSLASLEENDNPMALEHLIEALTLAESENQVRIFVDEGARIHKLISEIAAKGILPDYTNKLMAVINTEK